MVEPDCRPQKGFIRDRTIGWQRVRYFSAKAGAPEARDTWREAYDLVRKLPTQVTTNLTVTAANSWASDRFGE